MKRWMLVGVAVGAIVALGCREQGTTEAGASATTPAAQRAATSATASASAGAADQDNPPPVGKAKLAPGDAVQLCWRRRPTGKPFAENPSPFQCAAEVKAVKAPWGDAEGAVHGKLLMDALRDVVPDVAQAKVWLRSVEPGQDPRKPGASMSADDSASSYFNNYVGADAAGKARLYVEVESP